LREEHAQLAALMEPAVVQTKAEALVV